jgi:hypothetical protein
MRFLGAEYVTSLVRYRIFEAQTSPKNRIFLAEICYFLRTILGGSFTGPCSTRRSLVGRSMRLDDWSPDIEEQIDRREILIGH